MKGETHSACQPINSIATDTHAETKLSSEWLVEKVKTLKASLQSKR